MSDDRRVMEAVMGSAAPVEPAGQPIVREVPETRPTPAETRPVEQPANRRTRPMRPADRGGCFLIVITALLYGRVCSAQFVSLDDGLHIGQNFFLLNQSAESLLHFWREPHFGLYIPVTYMFWAAETALSQMTGSGSVFSLNPSIYHAGSLLLHVACAVAVFHLLYALVADWKGAFVGAALFAWHPLQVESVAWISETKGLLAGLFGVLALLQYQAFRRSQPGSAQREILDRLAAQGSPSATPAWRYFAASAFYVLALLAKPSAVAIPLIACCIDLVWWRTSWRRALVPVIPWTLVGGLIILVTRSVQPDDIQTWLPPWWARPVIAADAATFYLKKLAWPVGLGLDYGRTPQSVLAQPWNFVWCLVPLGLALLAARSSQRQAYWTALGIFLAALAPSSGLVTFGHQRFSTVADRYAFVALLGPAFLLAWLASRHASRRWMAVCLAALAWLAGLTIAQVPVWHDSLALAENALAVNPDSGPANRMKGRALRAAGRTAESAIYFERSCQCDPLDASARLALVEALLESGQRDAARRELRQLLAQVPGLVADSAAMRAEITAITHKQVDEE